MLKQFVIFISFLFPTILHAETCSNNLSQLIEKSLRTSDYTITLDFKTHDFFKIQNNTYVLTPQGNEIIDADITHLLRVTSTTKDETYIIGNFTVRNNVLIYQNFCVVENSTKINI